SHQKLDQVAFGENQRSRLFEVTEEVVYERSFLRRVGQPRSGYRSEAVKTLLRSLSFLLERGKHHAIRRSAYAELEREVRKIAVEIRCRSGLALVEIPNREFKIVP